MTGFSVVHRNPGHWDVLVQGTGRAFAIRGEPGNVWVRDERRTKHTGDETFKTLIAAMAWIVDELMYEAPP